jgi:hypothetical protein
VHHHAQSVSDGASFNFFYRLASEILLIPASQVARIIEVSHNAWFLETRSPYIA